MKFLRDSSDDPRADRGLVRLDMDALDDSADDAERARILGRIAERCRFLGEYDAAIAHAQSAIDAASRSENAALIPPNLIRLATALQYSGQHELALELLEQVLSLQHRPGSERYVHYALQHMGKCLAEMGRVEEAQGCFERALALRQSLGDDQLLSSTISAITRLQGLRPPGSDAADQ